MSEKCWFIYGKKIGPYWIGFLKYHSKGSIASVGFNWSLAADPNIMGFFHSHPGGSAEPSIRDDKTMCAWIKAEGRPLLCGIFGCQNKKCFIYSQDGCYEIKNKIWGNFFLAWK